MSRDTLISERKMVYESDEQKTSIYWLNDFTYKEYANISYGNIIYIDEHIEVVPICISILNHKNVYCYGMTDSRSDEEKNTLYSIGFEDIEEYFKLLISEFAAYECLFVRYYNRHNTKPINVADLERIMFVGKTQISFSEALENLCTSTDIKETLTKSHSTPLLYDLQKLKAHIDNCSVGQMRFSRNDRTGFSEIENELNDVLFRKMYYYKFCLKAIDSVSKILNISEKLLEDMCITEKLLNTEKIGDMWFVDIDDHVIKS